MSRQAGQSWVLLAALLLVLLACKGKTAKCMVASDFGEGMRYASVGTGSSRAEAEKGARDGTCMLFCEYSDEGVVTTYRHWKQTPEGQKSNADRSFDMDMHLKQQYRACIDKCRLHLANIPRKTECL